MGRDMLYAAALGSFFTAVNLEKVKLDLRTWLTVRLRTLYIMSISEKGDCASIRKS